jgi:hypothetical protein
MATLEAPHFAPRRALAITAALALLGLAVAAIAIAVDPARALLGYLAAYVTVCAIAVGALVLLQIGYATNARWLAPLRRLQESITLVFPVLAVLFVPIALGLEHIYVWADPHAQLAPHVQHALDTKRAWLSPTAFVIRSATYLAIFLVTAEVLRRWSRRRDGLVAADDAEVALRRERMFACAMLPPVGLAITFAAFDWVMSLQPAWFSTMFGIYVFAGGFSAGIGVLVLLAWQEHTGQSALLVTRNHFHALGRMLFAFVVFWAYTSYFQGFLIQIADRPVEVEFYIVRLHGGWYAVLWAVILARFALPFFLLLPRSLKFRPRYVATVSVIVIVGHVLDVYWLVVPSGSDTALVHWGDIAALIGIAAACVAVGLWRQRDVPLVVTGDPFLRAGIAYESPT